MPTEGPIQVGAGNEDAHETDAGGSFSSTNNYVFVSANFSASGRFNGGALFTVPNIATGDTIDSVDFELHYATFPSDDTQVDLFANYVDDAADFSAEADVTTRVNSAATIATAQWVHTATDVDRSTLTDGVDMNAIIQEVIDRAGWNPGQDMVILIAGRSDVGTALSWSRSFNGSPANAPELTITYTVGGDGPPVLASRRLLSGVGR